MSSKKKTEQIHEALKKHGKVKNWQRIVCVLAVLTIFLSEFSMTQPAVTMSQEAFCNIEEHVHTEDCYEIIPTCGFSGGGVIYIQMRALKEC